MIEPFLMGIERIEKTAKVFGKVETCRIPVLQPFGKRLLDNLKNP
jgi:hypothetical protein